MWQGKGEWRHLHSKCLCSKGHQVSRSRFFNLIPVLAVVAQDETNVYKLVRTRRGAFEGRGKHRQLAAFCIHLFLA